MSKHNCKNCTHKVVCALWEIQNELCDSECTYYQLTFTPQNEPLTLEQLREMDGDKINIHFIGDCAGFYEDEISPYYGDHEQYIQRYNGMLRVCDLPLKYYGTQWTATLYRHPPERH